MNYSMLIMILSTLIFTGCGTESNPSKENLNWASEGLENQEINSLEVTSDKLYIASNTQLSSKVISPENEWDNLEFHINSETSEFGDILLRGNTLFVVVRNTIDYHDLPEDYHSLYNSSDQGENWQPIEIILEDREKPFVINRIAKSENNSLFADWHFIYKSSNGVEWTNLSRNTNVGVSEFLYISDEYPNQIWTGGWTNTFSPYLAKSADGGETWTLLDENIAPDFSQGTVYDIIVSPNNENVVLAGLNGGVLKSTDGGESWESSYRGIEYPIFQNSIKSANWVYASGQSPQGQLFVAISDDYGDSWEIETYEESPGGIQTNDMVVAEVNGNETLYFGTNKGVYSLSFE